MGDCRSNLGYNLLEELVSIYFCISDEIIALFGFGVDSFIEAISRLGIVAMVVRIRQCPEIIALISILTMWALVSAKHHVGRKLNSAPILADANCTLVCIYMSVVLLISSLVYKLTGLGPA